MKLYIYSVDDSYISAEFVNTIRTNIPNVIYIDYDTFKYNLVSRLYPMLLLKTIRTKKMVDKICDIATEYNDLVFKKFVDDINIKTTTRSKVFIRCNNIKFINKLKRYYKRDKYYTVRIINTTKILTDINKSRSVTIKSNESLKNTTIQKLDNYKWDSKIVYLTNDIFIKDTKRFMINKIGLKIIH